MSETVDKVRVDKWLWHARFFKSRGLAAEAVTGGVLRVNGTRVAKAAHAIRPGDVLTFAKAGEVRVIRIDALGERRGPAPEAAALYTDLDPPAARDPAAEDAPRPSGPETAPGSGRPTKRARREIDALRGRSP